MSTEDLTTQDQTNPLEMSDEQIMEMDLFSDGLSPDAEKSSDEDGTQAEGDEITSQDEDQDELETDSDEDPNLEAEDGQESSDEEEETDEEELDGDDDTEESGEENSEESDDVDYKSEVEKILSPFKANGKEIQVDSVDDAITLMKMGANYNKKMAALKPNLKIMRMLENQELLDEGKLSYLIDLHKKKPEAINKLVKDSGLDPLEMNLDETGEYTPDSYSVGDREIALEEVLDDIKDTSTYSETVDLITNKWDEDSRDILVKHPEIIALINEQKQNGIFEQISTVVEKEKMLGRLTGLSDIAAYKQVGDRLHAEGKFGPNQGSDTTEANETVSTKPAGKPKTNPQLKKRKKAASSTRTKTAPKAPTDYNPLAMSDEDFEKIAASQYM